MAGLQGLTRQEIRVEVGRLIRAVRLVTSAANGSTTTFLMDSEFGDADDQNIQWWRGTGPANNDGTKVRITDSSVASDRTTLTLFPAVTSTATNDTAEIWDGKYDPTEIENLINRAIRMVTGEFFNDVTDITFHGGQGGSVARIDIPTTFEQLTDVLYRSAYDHAQVLGAGAVWNESVDTDFKVTQDNEDRLFNRVATKFDVAATVSNGDLASHAVTSQDLSGYTHIEFPIKVRTGVAASDLVLRLSTTANGADTDKIIAIPALSAGVDTWVRVAMTEAVSSFDPSETTAIISVALEYNANAGANTVNAGANTVWVGEIEATREDGTVWTPVQRSKWTVDRQARDLVFIRHGSSSTGAEDAGYALFKLVGGDFPVMLDADGTVSEVPEDWIINQVAAMALVIYGDESDAKRAAVFAGWADQARAGFPDIREARKIT
jgi:hypothetical protein